MATRTSKTLKRFEEGDKVVLKANKKEGWPRETGTVIEVCDQEKYPGMYGVEVDNVSDPDDDGIREVHASQMVLVLELPGR